VLEENKPQKGDEVLDPQIAREINQAISTDANRAFIFGAGSRLTLGDRPVAAKTGTTNDFKDAWTCGYTPSLVVGVWVGNNNGKEMKTGADGSVVAAPIWNAFMKEALKDSPKEAFTAPDEIKTGKPILDGVPPGTVVYKIDKNSGKLATEYTPQDLIIEKTYQTQPHDILFYVDKNDPRGPVPSDPAQDPQYNLWEAGVQAWIKKNNIAVVEEVPTMTEYDDTHTSANQPTVEIFFPQENQIVTGPTSTFKILASAPRGIKYAQYFIDDQQVASSFTEPWSATIDFTNITKGTHKLNVKVFDDVQNQKDASVNFVLEK
jgi:membrane peptidoglycan carboxypeptidase